MSATTQQTKCEACNNVRYSKAQNEHYSCVFCSRLRQLNYLKADKIIDNITEQAFYRMCAVYAHDHLSDMYMNLYDDLFDEFSKILQMQKGIEEHKKKMHEAVRLLDRTLSAKI